MAKLTLKEMGNWGIRDLNSGKRSVKMTVNEAISDIYSNMINQGGVNLLKNWSFENGTGGVPYYWDNEVSSKNVNNKVSILQDSTKSLIGNYCGKVHIDSFVKGGTPSDWYSNDYRVFFTGSSDAIKLQPNTSVYRCNFHMNSDKNIPVSPKVKMMFLAYSDYSGSRYLETLKNDSYLNIGSGWNPLHINLDTSHNASIKSIRVYFEILVPNKVSTNNPFYDLYIDCISFYAGRLLGGASPFVLTEDTWSADIGEKYISLDKNIENGSIVTFGKPVNGKPAVRIATISDTKKPLFCVTNSYFFSLRDNNSFQEGYSECDIALIGRVKCKVSGRISLGKPITIKDNGVGRVARNGDKIVGSAITENDGGDGEIFIIVGK